MKPTIELWNGVGLGIILEHPSGVLYSNQTGGTACLHPAVEGVFIPLRNDCEIEGRRLLSPENDLYEYFEGPKHHGTGATDGLDAEDAEFIDSVLKKWSLAECVALDRDRLADSHEAWVHVFVTSDEGDEQVSVFSGFGPYPRAGILTWSNTD